MPDETSATLDQIRERSRKAAAREGDAAEWLGAALRSATEDVPLLLAAIEALTAALERHQQWFKNEHGTRICGGCLEPVPCKDTDVIGRALAGKDSSDE